MNQFYTFCVELDTIHIWDLLLLKPKEKMTEDDIRQLTLFKKRYGQLANMLSRDGLILSNCFNCMFKTSDVANHTKQFLHAK